MPQAQKSHSHAQVMRITFSHFQSSSLWGNKNWPPSIKAKKLENLGNKIALIGCKWSRGNKNWPPSIKVKEMENLGNKIDLIGCKWSSLNAPGIEKPVPHSGVDLSFLNFCSTGSLCPNGEWRGCSPFECYATVASKSSHIRGCDKRKKILAFNKRSFFGPF